MLGVFRQEIKMQRGSWLVWTLAVLCLAAVYVSVYPAFASDAKVVTETFAKLPQAVKNAMGTGGFRLLNFPGFFANVLPIFMLAGGIQAASLGISMTNRDRIAGTSDFLLSKPLGRSRIFWQKLFANLILLLATSAALIGGIYLGSRLINVDSFSSSTYLMVMAAFTFVQCWFLAVGVAIAQIAGRIRNSIGVSIALCFGLFVLAMFSSVVGDETIRYLTPYKYIDLLKVVQEHTYDIPHLIVGVAIIIVGTALGWLLYTHRDVEAA